MTEAEVIIKRRSDSIMSDPRDPSLKLKERCSIIRTSELRRGKETTEAEIEKRRSERIMSDSKDM